MPDGGRAWVPICMSDSDPPTWDLSLEIEGLSLRLRGLRVSPETRDTASRPSSPRSSLSGFSVISSGRLGAPKSPARVPPEHLCSSAAQPSTLPAGSGLSKLPRIGSLALPLPVSSLPPRLQSYPSTPCRAPRLKGLQIGRALGFPVVPDSCVALCRGLSVSELGPTERAERAWLAGCWAGAVLAGLVDRPDPSAPLSLQSRFYCVLRAEGLASPVVCSSLSIFRRIVGHSLGSSVTHGFPSSSEARVYFSGAGLPYPPALTR